MRFLLIGLLFFTVGCDKDAVEDDNRTAILNYLEVNEIMAQSTPSGLHYHISKEGDGQHPSIDDEVSVYYKGYFLNGDVFDERSRPLSPISFPLRNVILGWQEGIPLLSRGGEATLFIPAHLGYGSNPPSGIPTNSVLIFDVELVDF